MRTRINRFQRRSVALLLAWLLLAGPLSAAFPQTFPEPVGYVNDFANIIPENTERQITALCTEVEQKTGAEIAVVTVETVDDEDYTTYANKLFEAWGIGKKGDDRGILLFTTMQERKVRIEVGYGLEPIITDGTAGAILDQHVLPYYDQNDYGSGMLAGTRAIAEIIAGEAGVELTGQPNLPPRPQARNEGDGIGWLKFILMLIFIIFFLSGRGGFLPFLFLGGLGGGRRSSWGGFGGSSGGFSGGFGGFGGGMSGGGGAGRGF